MNSPYRSPSVYHTVHLSEAEVKEAIRVYADTHSGENFPVTGSTIRIIGPRDGGFTAEVVGPNVIITETPQR